MELLTGRLPLQEPDEDDEKAWEAQSTGRSSNEGLEAWVAHADGGFRLKGTPPTPLPPQVMVQAASGRNKERGGQRKGRGRSKERRGKHKEPQQSVAPHEEELEPVIQDAQPDEAVAESKMLNPRRKEAANSVAQAISAALKLTPGTRQIVTRAAELGAAAAFAMPPTPVDGADDKENEEHHSNRDKKKGKGKSKSGKSKGRGSKKLDKEQGGQPVELAA